MSSRKNSSLEPPPVLTPPFDRSQSDPTTAPQNNPVTPGFRDLRTDQGSNSSSFSFLNGGPSALEQERIQTDIENLLLTNLSLANQQKELERNAKQSEQDEKKGLDRSTLPRPSAFDLNDLVGFFKGGMEVIVQDGFSRCFESSRSQPWNWNLYLWPLWAMGVIIRYFILFPLRALSLLTGLLITLLALTILKVIPINEALRSSLQRKLIRFLCGVFVFSWTGVIKYHGTIQQKKPNQIYVANHTSMIDVIVLSQMNTFSMVGQKHPGWVGFLQTHVLGIIGTVWFQRGEADDRVKSAKKMKEHIQNPQSNRLLVFPEGTCVNNEYCVQFKQGVFDMGAEICPIAIKYNKIFVDAFWNSKAQSFQAHLATLMCSWALVCDVYYLEPQRIQPGENGIAFSNRVKKLIADKIGLRNVSYDGYLKHFEVKSSLIEKQQKMYADMLLKRLTPEEKREIEEEEAAEAKRKALAIKNETASPPSTTTAEGSAGPDSLILSPSPEVPTLRHLTPSAAKTLRSTSDPAGSLSPQSALANVGSSADLMALLNEVQEEERRAASAQTKDGQQLKQRK